MSNDNKALVALMDLVLAIADAVCRCPEFTQKAVDRIAAEKREVEGWRETLYLLGTEANRRVLAQATGRPGILLASSDGQEAKAAVEATVRRWEAYADKARMRQEAIARLDLGSQSVAPPLEADDSRVTDGSHDPYAGCSCSVCQHRRATKSHTCCGGKPDCGCRSVGG